jgi:hypothetical protein
MRRWRRWLFSDWRLKATALALATVIWAGVKAGTWVQVTIDVPLELRNRPRATAFAKRPPATIRVRLEAPGEVLKRLTPDNLAVVVDLEGRVKGPARRLELALTVDDVTKPEGVRVLEVSPSTLVLEFEPARRAAP